MRSTLSEVLATKDSSMIHVARVEESVLEAALRMTDLKIGCLLVVNSRRRPVGIFTERDVLRRVVAAGRDPTQTLVESVMTTPLISAPRSMTVTAALVLVTERRFRRLPIMQGRRIVGLLTVGDLTRWLVDRQRAQITELNDYVWGPVGAP